MQLRILRVSVFIIFVFIVFIKGGLRMEIFKDLVFGIIMLPVIIIWVMGKLAGHFLDWAIETFLDV